MDTSRLRFCTPVQKRSILKIAIELVKADNKIHSKEISVLDDLQESLGLTQEELDLIHYAPLSEAVSVISGMDEQTVNVVMGVFDSIMRIDSDIDFEENLQRCICLDSRYMLFVIDKYANAQNLIDEMDIVR